MQSRDGREEKKGLKLVPMGFRTIDKHPHMLADQASTQSVLDPFRARIGEEGGEGGGTEGGGGTFGAGRRRRKGETLTADSPILQRYRMMDASALNSAKHQRYRKAPNLGIASDVGCSRSNLACQGPSVKEAL